MFNFKIKNSEHRLNTARKLSEERAPQIIAAVKSGKISEDEAQKELRRTMIEVFSLLTAAERQGVFSDLALAVKDDTETGLGKLAETLACIMCIAAHEKSGNKDLINQFIEG